MGNQKVIMNLKVELFKVLAHPARIQILKLLESDERCVCELIEEMGVEQSNLSQHLSILKKQGLIASRKDGTRVFYTALYPTVIEILQLAEALVIEQVNQSKTLLQDVK
ncbi:ArsR/SmtB family transcription factor [Pelosinus baikalensis]|uniref:Metalloregulator ArsR/SmtB family transcription factor n=1 Tax=Pelosinus baikalensis TaxID=2892015 RepID=A0ABS8HT11_9FIRM|nr:metalloregulator ArsR/SmtB family transcription factor [Pelosinus baikalensis]MCC5466290.1 metalloregulator ArsR/SmtB family transcription factor [Pelosinus baikalensis]